MPKPNGRSVLAIALALLDDRVALLMEREFSLEKLFEFSEDSQQQNWGTLYNGNMRSEQKLHYL